jgi:ABC-type nitrate/sulfonate/bicarbonate transport system substrate-binding protein
MQHRLGAFLIVMALAGSIAAAWADTTIRLGQVPSTMKSIGVVPYVIADQKGFFTREHLAVQLVPLDGGTDQMVKRLDAGDVEVSSSATPYSFRRWPRATRRMSRLRRRRPIRSTA